MKILVTGAAGFIGYHTSLALLKLGHTIVGLDNINDYYDVRLKHARLSNLGIEKYDQINMQSSLLYDNFSFCKIDIHKDALELSGLFEREKFDVVCHLAAQAGVRYSLENPQAYADSNISGFINILECSRNHDIQHLVYASSSSVYGLNDKVPFSEDDDVCNPTSLYAATKRANELMATVYYNLYKLHSTGLRFFTVYGPYGRPDMAPILFANAITNNKAINVFNNGDLERDFTYIDDIVEGVVNVTVNKPKASTSVYNIGCSTPVKLMDFISEMECAFDKKAILINQPMQKGDVYKTYADTSRLEKDYNYKPSTPLSIGLKEFAKWFKEYNTTN